MFRKPTLKEALTKEFAGPLGAHRAFAIEAMRLLVYLEKVKRHGQDFNCFVYESSSSKEFLTALNMLVHFAKNLTESIRVQFLIKQGGHYTAVDVHLTAGKNEFIVLDSAGDVRFMAHYLKLEALKDEDGQKFFSKGYIVVGMSADNSDYLQTDCFSCPILAFDCVRQISRIDNIYQLFADKADEFGYLSWQSLPVQMIWNAQSFDFIRVYIANHPDEVKEVIPSIGATLEEYLMLINGKDNYVNRRVNVAAGKLFSQVSQEAIDYINVTAEDKLLLDVTVMPLSLSRIGDSHDIKKTIC